MMNNFFEQNMNEKISDAAGEINCSEELMQLAVKFVQQLQESDERPEGIVKLQEDQQNPDLYTMLEAVTALRQEISLQGRSFHQLEQTLKQWVDSPVSSSSLGDNVHSLTQKMDHLESEVHSLASQTLKSEREAGREEGRSEAFSLLLDPLLDTHDQLRRLEEQNIIRVKQNKKRFFSRFRKIQEEEFLNLISLTSKKINQRLEKMNVIAIARCGMEFNPATMKAIEMEHSDFSTSHLVSEIYRQGYIHQERVIRFAEVKVTVPATEKNEHNE